MEEVSGRVDQVIAGRYRLRELIGQGGMGCVWRAEHLALHSSVAIKLLTPTVGDKADSEARFIREAQAAASIKSVNVVQILDHGVEHEMPYIAMEYLEGESLKSCLRREKKLTPEKTSSVMRGVMRAIVRAHRVGIVHRDLKPDNIFLARDGDDSEPVVKVLDFGIAKLVEKVTDDVSTRTGTMLGTPFYMSPEQARGLKDLDARSDLWSLAVIVFECLTGKRPFEADVIGNLIMLICADPIPVPSAIAPVPAGFDAWFARATQRERGRRYANATEFATALAAVISPGEVWFDTKDAGRLSLSDSGAPIPEDALAPTAFAPGAPKDGEAETSPKHGTTASSVARSIAPASRAKGPLPIVLAGAAGTIAVALAIGLTLDRGSKSDAPTTEAARPLEASSVPIAHTAEPPSADPPREVAPRTLEPSAATLASNAGAPVPTVSATLPRSTMGARPTPTSSTPSVRTGAAGSPSTQEPIRDPLRDL